jgi:hypothetical protein
MSNEHSNPHNESCGCSSTPEAQEQPQALLLTDTICPLLRRLHPSEGYLVGHGCELLAPEPDSGEPVSLRPDWLYASEAPGSRRQRYDMQEHAAPPQVVLELVEAGKEARRARYEALVRAPFYACYDAEEERLECFWFDEGRYRQLRPNARGQFPVPPLNALLGIWRGYYRNERRPWLRWWDSHGELLLTSGEQAAQERQLVEQEQLRTERLAALLRSLSGGTDQEK